MNIKTNIISAFSIIICLSLFACQAITENKTKENRKPITAKKNLKISKTLTLNNKKGIFKIKYELSNETELVKIKIYHANHLQTIDYDKDFIKLELLDWNFDGLKDLSILENEGATGNSFYHVWNFNPSSNLFEKNHEIKGSMYLDTINKYVVNHLREGFQLEYWDYLTYEGSKLKLHHSKVIESGCCIKNKHWKKTKLIHLVKGKPIEKIEKFEFLE